MCVRNSQLLGGLAFVAMVVCLSAGAHAQTVPWQVRVDPVSGTECGVINAENVEFVVLQDTGELVIVSEDGVDVDDEVVFESFVDEIGNVFLSNVQVGQVRFAEDANGATTLWWLDLLSDRVYFYDRAVDQPTLGTLMPSDIVGLGCDPCTVWDIAADCAIVDGGGTGGGDTGTGGGNTDGGNTGGGNTNTNVGDVSSLSFNFCGANTGMSMMLTFAGLVGTGLVRRPRRRSR